MEKLILEGITRSQIKGREITPQTLQIERWLEGFEWGWLWDLSPRGLLDSLAMGSTARTILAAYERRTGTRLAAFLVLEPFRSLPTAYHLHALLQADHLDPDAFRQFSRRWGQTRVEQYRGGGGFASYLARKIALGAAILDVYGTPTKKEVDNVDWN